MRRREPVSTPAGIFRAIFCFAVACPVPWHARHGFSSVEPSPLHVGHVCWMRRKPPPPMTTPWPPHVGQTTRLEPGAAPVPWQAGQAAGIVSSKSRVEPKIASSKSISKRYVMSSPRRGALGSARRREREPMPPKKSLKPPNEPPPEAWPPKTSPNMEKMSSMFMPPAPKPPAPPPLANA